ncbi:angiotensin-converting enzyme-like [Mercenaria mercenaria]|uniref:angiotensin-converting enzyme-like n=1 Tax=Mercenaria mercenaria TaxID=6596 RepID=UPI00234E8289|nr:angiotensin-converting enzyme-like [Mercenaria mercenaria]XP_045209599.2 angiotensin-converting enzyme-like [Mercenaria mercenaria]
MMASGNAGRWLLILTVTVTLYVGCVSARDQRLDGRSVARQLNQLRMYMEELEFIEEEEKRQGVKAKGKTTVEEQVMLKACNVALDDNEIKLNPYDDFVKEVEADVDAWDECLRLWTNEVAIANWNFETDLTNENEEALSKASLDFTRWSKGLAQNAQVYIDDPRYHHLDFDLKRKLRFMAFSTDPDEDMNDMKELIDAQTKLQQTYSEATVEALDQGNGAKTLKLEPHLTEIMAKRNDSKLLLAAWWGWRNATGPFMRKDYAKMVKLLNKGATQHNFSNYADAWIASQFDQTPDLEEDADNLWNDIRPLYEQLHAYVRTKLQQKYPEYNHIFNSGGIPAHLLGNMWAQDWENIYDRVKPYPELEEPDYEAELKAQGYTAERMFETAEQFYKSIGLSSMSNEFKTLSMKVRPENREVVCHASASDFYSKKPDKDFRIKMCTAIDMDSFQTIHHEMGHIEYFMAYQDQPAVYRTGANSAFHEAIGDTISLSVRSPEHLRDIGLCGGNCGGKNRGNKENIASQRKRLTALIRELEVKKKRDINFLFKRALFKIGFLPFGYMIDKWRWNVFRGLTTEENYNKDWWNLRLKYQGLVAPVPRSEADFDPGAKYHIPSNSPYICYFISFIVQFEFYKAMCDESGHKGHLFECDFYRSKDAGRKLLDMMKLGKSKPWPEAMVKLTGSNKISTTAILEYFRPLQKWLEDENSRPGVQIGWKNAEISWKTGP